MAFKMQSSVPEMADLSTEPERTFERWGEEAKQAGKFQNAALMARRLVERGVRFVQIYHRGWDVHSFAPQVLPAQAADVDRAAWALIQDLKERGLFDETLGIWGGEFGRTIYSQGRLTPTDYGRDHHPRCFSLWMAGGGVKGGTVYGETDDFSYNIVKDPVHIRDFQATILHLFGIDHERFTHNHRGLDLVYHPGRFDTGEASIQAAVVVGKPLVVDTEQVENGRLEISDVHWVLDDVVREIVGLPVDRAALHSTPRHPKTEAPRVMVATVVGRGEPTLRVDRAAEFPPPNPQGLIEEPTLFQVLNERPGRAVNVRRLRWEHLRRERVHVPSPVVNLHEPHTALDETSRHQRRILELPGLLGFLTPPFERALGLGGEIGHLGHG
jgi:hypothetical protein